MADGRPGERTVQREERRVERLGKSDVGGVVRGHVAPERPDPTYERARLVQVELERQVQSERFLGALARHRTGQAQAADERRNLEIDVTRSVQERFGLLDPSGDDSTVVRA